MYFGQVGLFIENEGKPDEGSVLQGLLLTHSIYKNPEILKTWEDLVEPIDFLVESADDLSIREYARTLYGVYGKDFDINKLDDNKNLSKVYTVLKSYPDPQVAGFMGKSFRYMPQRAVMDSVLMQNVVDIAGPNHPSDRPIYSGLDLMSLTSIENSLSLFLIFNSLPYSPSREIISAERLLWTALSKILASLLLQPVKKISKKIMYLIRPL